MTKIAHIVNLFAASATSEHGRAQAITCASLERALRTVEGHVEVELFSAQTHTDREIVPDFFRQTPDLDRSVLDFGTFEKPRTLPLLRDILSRLHDASNAPYFIYTNADIAVTPQFYLVVSDLIEQGYDAFAIFRRRLSRRFESADQLDSMYAELGEPHLGFDCLVFERRALEHYVLGNVCLGIPHVGNLLAHNMMCYSKRFEIFADKHLTFHIGLELVKEWGDSDYLEHNSREFRKALQQIEPDLDIENVPAANLGLLKRHFIWLMNPTFHYPTMLRTDLRQLAKPRRARSTCESRSRYFEWLVRAVNPKRS